MLVSSWSLRTCRIKVVGADQAESAFADSDVPCCNLGASYVSSSRRSHASCGLRMTAMGLSRSRGNAPTLRSRVLERVVLPLLSSEAIRLVHQQEQNHGIPDSDRLPAAPAHARRHAHAQAATANPSGL